MTSHCTRGWLVDPARMTDSQMRTATLNHSQMLKSQDLERNQSTSDYRLGNVRQQRYQNKLDCETGNAVLRDLAVWDCSTVHNRRNGALDSSLGLAFSPSFSNTARRVVGLSKKKKKKTETEVSRVVLRSPGQPGRWSQHMSDTLINTKLPSWHTGHEQ